MNWVHKLLDALVCKDQTPQIEMRDNEIKRLQKDLDYVHGKYQYLIFFCAIVTTWAVIATLAAIELGIH